ncbi:uridine kinase [Actinopolymorpha pittospori]
MRAHPRQYERDEVVTRLAEHLARHRLPHRLRVAVDGPDAAGKTRLADDVAVALRRSRNVIRLGVDDFHRPEKVRRRRGSLSPEGYYLDAFDQDAVVGSVLRPLGPGGDGHYLPATYDLRSEEPVVAERRRAHDDAILLFDGVFLLRPQVRDHWDVTVHLHVEPEETLRRALVRDVAVFGSAAAVEERYLARYLPGQELYRAEARPLDRADIVLDMGDPLRPVVVRWPSDASRRS